MALAPVQPQRGKAHEDLGSSNDIKNPEKNGKSARGKTGRSERAKDSAVKSKYAKPNKGEKQEDHPDSKSVGIKQNRAEREDMLPRRRSQNWSIRKRKEEEGLPEVNNWSVTGQQEETQLGQYQKRRGSGRGKCKKANPNLK